MSGLALFVLAALVVLLTVVREGSPDEVDPRRVDVVRASPAAAAAALATFVSGVDARDATVLTGLAPRDDPGARDVLAGVAANAASLRLSTVSARYIDQVGTVAADGTWSAVAALGWRVAGEATPSQADVVIRFSPDGDGVGIVGFGGADTGRVPLWLQGELSVARAPGVLVLADATRDEADALLERVTRGIAVVRRVLPGWRSPVVVEAPASADDLDEALGAAPGTYAGIAAVTATPGSADRVGAPVHVFVNPQVTAGLRRAGAQVVMSHELVHVATDAVRRPIEPWLLEGFADWIALRDSGLPDRVTLSGAIESARRDGVPDTLPDAADFDTRARDLRARYEEAWLACRILAARLGEPGLVDLYAKVRGGDPLDRALARDGLTLDRLTVLWRDRLDQLAR